MGKAAAPEEAGDQGEGVASEDLVKERLLARERFCHAATGGDVFREAGVSDLGIEFGHGSQPGFVSAVGSVSRLAENELASVRAVAQIEPLCKRFSAYV